MRPERPIGSFIPSLAVAAIASIGLDGCGSPQAANTPKTNIQDVQNRLANTNNGIELRRWTVVERPGALVGALAKASNGAAADADSIERLKRNGWRFVRVPVDQLDPLKRGIGEVTVDANEWHGQALEWRSLQDRPIDARGQAIAVDGRLQRYEGGEFRMLMRGWTVQMEDGPRVHLEIAPEHRSPQVNTYKRMLGQEGERDEGFGSLALDMQMEPGFAYILVGESPQAAWPGIDAEEAPGAVKAAPRTHHAASRIGPQDSMGPEVATPRTLGEVLLPVEGSPQSRSVLVFVPKVGPELFPPDLLAQNAADQANRDSTEAGSGNGSSGNSASKGDSAENADVKLHGGGG